MLALGIAGFGVWGRRYLQACLEAGGARITTALLRQGSASADAASQAGLRVVHDIDALQSLDAMVVAVHPSAAPQICLQLLQRGLPVMMEKPSALSAERAMQVQIAERDSGSLVLVNHQHLFSVAFEALMTHTRGQQVLEVQTHAGNLGPFRDYSALWDYGPHDIAMCLSLFGCEPHAVHCVAKARIDPGMNCLLSLDFDGPRMGTARIHLDNTQGPRVRRLTVGEWCYDDANSQGSRLWHQGQASTCAPYEPPLTRSMRAFAQAVLDGGTTDPRFGAHWGTQVARVLEAAQADSQASSPSSASPRT